MAEHRGAIGAALLTVAGSAWISAAVVVGTVEGQWLGSPVPLGLGVAGVLTFAAALYVLVGFPTAQPAPLEHMSERGLGTRTDSVTWKAIGYLADRRQEDPGIMRTTDPAGREVTTGEPDPQYERETLASFQREFGADLLALFDELERRGFIERDARPDWKARRATTRLTRWSCGSRTSRTT